MRWPFSSARAFCALHLCGLGTLLAPGANAQEPVLSRDHKPVGDWMYPVATWEAPVQRRGLDVNSRRSPRIQRRTEFQRKIGIVIPKVEFKSTPFSDAIEFLRQEAVRLDPEPDPVRRGIKIVCDPLPVGPKLTLTMCNLPLDEALRYLAEQAGMELKIGEETVTLVPVPAKMELKIGGETITLLPVPAK